LNRSDSAQLEFDLLTGLSTAIHSRYVSENGRKMIGSLNRSRENNLPTVELSALGMTRGEVGLESSSLTKLKSGKEAEPFLSSSGVVYKFFDLSRPLGPKYSFEPNADGEFEMTQRAAAIEEIVKKISILHDAGCHPTEIVGLAERADYLIVKQPEAFPQDYSNGIVSCSTNDLAGYATRDLFIHDLKRACESMKAVPVVSRGFKEEVFATVVGDEAWIIGDLKFSNIMRDSAKQPTIFDALTGLVTSRAEKEFPLLSKAVTAARRWRIEGVFSECEDLLQCEDSDL
jgi:hypothetical protein